MRRHDRAARAANALGNIGLFGGLHAAVGALSSHVIDNVAYDGVDMRFQVNMRQTTGNDAPKMALLSLEI